MRKLTAGFVGLIMIALRNIAFRALSRQNTSLACRSRSIHTIITTSTRISTQRSSVIHFQRRFASEEAQTQSEPVADGAQGQHGDNSIAESSSGESNHNATRQEHSTIGDLAGKVKETTSNAYDAIIGGTGGENRSSELSPKRSNADNAPNKSVYLGNLFFDVREDDIRKKFEGLGEIESIKLVTDNRGLSKGFGYVNFTSQEAATNAVDTFNGQAFEGRILTVQYAASRQPFVPRNLRPGPFNDPTRTLFIGNMSFDMTDKELNNLFREIRNVVDVRVAIDRRTGQPRGFAHADFTDVESAKAAMAKLSGKEVAGRSLRIDYSQGQGRSREGRSQESAPEDKQQGY
ncbi:MAG: hypothetical protein L6R40_005394 [Gallowayella cf. fulva]|nr:MAG: hypothetical protein L6R40_005394 [Xanthomendoza cf. fulva]